MMTYLVRLLVMVAGIAAGLESLEKEAAEYIKEHVEDMVYE